MGFPHSNGDAYPRVVAYTRKKKYFLRALTMTLLYHQPCFYPAFDPVHIFSHGFFPFWPDCFIDFK
jgi:hypothetical protein